ncbi:hypothetical protein [Variovorax atrisoli]|uniref:hypothetical protein n=1 Tax=Variovorax atrisoli TaxID=3394203 RepID=UPI0040402562
MPNPEALPTAVERIEAVENFLQQLVLLLEVEPDITRENIGAWMELCSASARAHGLQSRRQALAMEHLRARVLGPSLDIEHATPGAWLS